MDCEELYEMGYNDDIYFTVDGVTLLFVIDSFSRVDDVCD